MTEQLQIVRVLVGVVAAAVIAALALAGPAGAASRGLEADSAGTVFIKLDKSAAKSLRESKVRIGGTGGAETSRRSLRLPISSGTVGSAALLSNTGGLKLTAKAKGKKRSVRLGGLRTVIADGRGYMTARYRGEQITLASIGEVGSAPYDPLTGRVAVADAPVRFDRATAITLADRLGVKKLRSKLGTIAIDATVAPAPAKQSEATVRPRPATAVDVIGGTLTWRARTSWVDYLHAAGTQGGTSTSAGATDGPAEVIPPSSDARVYQYDFPFSGGWFDAASDTANVEFGGTVTYFKKIQPFNIDLDTSDPVIELGGAAPKMIATLNGRGNNSDQVNRRAVTVDLNQGAVTPVVTSGPGTSTYTWTAVPGRNPDGAASWPIAGYYQPGDAWGSVSVSLTVAQ